MNIEVCTRCGRVNPAGAHYCHYDGLALDNRNDASPLDMGSQVFHIPLLFPTGRICRSFDELVLAAEEDWDGCLALLKKGELTRFLGSIGRTDLAFLARAAAQAADLDDALDSLLGRLPSRSRQEARLKIAPLELNLGIIQPSETRTVRLLLSNEGMGLLQGTLAVEKAPWVVLGEPPGAPRKLFECRRDQEVVVTILGERMRASRKVQEAKIRVETDGGSAAVLLRAERQVQPFAGGVLIGAQSPRQLAERAKAAGKDATPLFESGAVRDWYQDNGWTYPVPGAAASGRGAAQRYFEAVGLATTPLRLEISERAVKMQGKPGETLEYALKVTCKEMRAFSVTASSSAPWLAIDNVYHGGRVARIHLLVTAVPDRPGESLLGRVEVQANDGQRFSVAVALRVEGVPRPAPILEPVAVVPLEPEPKPEPVPPSLAPPDPLPSRPVRYPVAAPASTSQVFGFAGLPAAEVDPVAVRRARSTSSPRLYLFAGSAVILLVMLLYVIVRANRPAPQAKKDTPTLRPPPVNLLDLNPYLGLNVHDGAKAEGPQALPKPTMRYGLILKRDWDPQEIGRPKRLTFDEWGRSGNVCVRLDGIELLYGEERGQWVELKHSLGKEPGSDRVVDGYVSIWQAGTVVVKQRLEIVPGRQSQHLDQCLVTYTLENIEKDKDKLPVRAGLRVLLHTHVGAVNGVPFVLPDQRLLCETRAAYEQPEVVPDFVEAVERNDFKNRGTIAHLQLRIGPKLEAPGRVYLGGWPHEALAQFGHPNAKGHLTLWDVPRVSMRELYDKVQELLREEKVTPESAALIKPDSAVTLYWDEKPLKPGETRTLGYAYGLGRSLADPTGRLLVGTGGRYVEGSEYTLIAQVAKPNPGETVKVTLPEGLEPVSGGIERTLPPLPEKVARPIGVASWRLRAVREGNYQIQIKTSAGSEVSLPVIIYPPRDDANATVYD